MADNKPTILKSTRLARAKGVNTLLFLKTAMVNMVLSCCESFLNTRYFIQQTDGTQPLPALEADVVTTEMGRVVTFPPITTAAAAGGSGTVPFSGNGAPGASTLAAGSYVARPVPSLYVDMTANALYVCTTAGTASTSVWAQIGTASTINGNYAGNWNPGQAYTPGTIIRNLNPTVVINMVTYNVTPGVFGCVLATTLINNGTTQAVMLPVYPEISGACWQLIAFAPMPVNVCSSGSKVIYIQSSEAF